MKNFFPYKLKNNFFFFCQDDENHIKNVVRLKLGEKIICNYDNKKYLCSINSLEPLNAIIHNLLPISYEFNNITIDLYQAIIKPKYMEWIISKCTEMQINNFYPTFLKRSQINNSINHSRMKAIAESAAKQSNRTIIPNINEQINFEQLIKMIPYYDLIVLPYENEKQLNLGQMLEEEIKQNTKKIGILVGPEGGFSIDEINKLKEFNNVKLVSLSKTILRSDTASFYTISILVDFLIRKNIDE